MYNSFTSTFKVKNIFLTFSKRRSLTITFNDPPVCQMSAIKWFALNIPQTNMRMEASNVQVTISFSTLGSLDKPHYLIRICNLLSSFILLWLTCVRVGHIYRYILLSKTYDPGLRR